MACTNHEAALRLLPFSEQVAVVGSYGLWEWQREQAGGASVGWSPGDVDVFVTGGDQESFEATAAAYLKAAQAVGIPLKIESKRSAIIDMCLEAHGGEADKSPAISFVRYRRAEAIHGIPASFDINICQVVLRISSEGERRFDISPEVEEAIRTRTLTVYRDISLQTAGSIKCRARVAKYEARGFKVRQGAVQEATTLAAPFTYFTAEEEALLGVVDGGGTPHVALLAHRWSQVDGCWHPVEDASATRKMVLTVGGAATGKTTLLSAARSKVPALESWRWIDMDAFLHGKGVHQSHGNSSIATEVNLAAANDEVDLHQLPSARAAGDNVVWDTTGMHLARLIGGKYRGVDVTGVLNWPGYSYLVIVVVCHPAVALLQNTMRPRQLDIATVLRSWTSAYQTAISLASTDNPHVRRIVVRPQYHCDCRPGHGDDTAASHAGGCIFHLKIATFDDAVRSDGLLAYILSLIPAVDRAQYDDDKDSVVSRSVADFCTHFESLQSDIDDNEGLCPDVMAELEHFVTPAPQRILAISTLSVVTYNMWGDPTAKSERCEGLLAILLAEDADVVCLQEVTRETLLQLSENTTIRNRYALSDEPALTHDQAAQSSFARRASCSLGIVNVTLVRADLLESYGATVTFNLLALPSEMSRHALLTTITIPSGDGGGGGGGGGGGASSAVIVANVHLDSDPGRPDLRIEQLGCLEDAIVKATKEFSTAGSTTAVASGVLCGDFNFSPAGVEESGLPKAWDDAWTACSEHRDVGDIDDDKTMHHGRIDRIFCFRGSASNSGLKAMRTKRLGVGVTVIGGSTLMPISDHFGLRADLKFL